MAQFDFFQSLVQETSVSKILYALVTSAVGYIIALAVYRSALSPLAAIPGPKLAAITYLYEAYYEVWLGGQYFKQVAELHKQYGPIVRVTPNEVHWNDPDFISNVYPGPARKTNKPLWFSRRTGTSNSIVSTSDHDLHRQRRNAVNPLFSMANIRRLEPITQRGIDEMFIHMNNASKAGQVVSMHRLFKAFTSDVIIQYLFGECFNFLGQPDCGAPYFDAIDSFFYLTHVFGLLPGFLAFAQTCPAWIVRIIAPFLSALGDRQEWWIEKVRQIRKSENSERIKTTILDGILRSTLPPREKTDRRLASEAQLITFAGEGTTAHSLTCCLFHLLDNPEEVRRLKAELASAVPDPHNMNMEQIDSLPYLNSIVQEGIRLHPGNIARQVRISPNIPLAYTNPVTGKAYSVPPNTVTSMSPLDIHLSAKVFGADAREFRPQRWIDDPGLKAYFMGFSRGARSCIGMTLARRLMALTLARIFLKYDVFSGQAGATLELYETLRERDIDADSDYVIPVPAAGSICLRVKIRSTN